MCTAMKKSRTIDYLGNTLIVAVLDHTNDI